MSKAATKEQKKQPQTDWQERMVADQTEARAAMVREYVSLIGKGALADAERCRASELMTSLGRTPEDLKADTEAAREEASLRATAAERPAVERELAEAAKAFEAGSAELETMRQALARAAQEVNSLFDEPHDRQRRIERAEARLREVETLWGDVVRGGPEPESPPKKERHSARMFPNGPPPGYGEPAKPANVEHRSARMFPHGKPGDADYVPRKSAEAVGAE